MEAEGGDDATFNAPLDDADGAESMAIACRSEAGAFGSKRILIFPDIAAGRSTRRAGERRMEGREVDNERERRRKTTQVTVYNRLRFKVRSYYIATTPSLLSEL